MDKLTAEKIREVIGLTDDELTLRILETGASESDLVAALTWLEEDDYIGPETHHLPDRAVARLCEILEQEKGPVEERD